MLRLLRVAAVVCSLAISAGCSTAADAGGSFGDRELINDVAARLAAASAGSYTATYSLSTAGEGSIAHTHDPDTTAFRFPGGMVLFAAGRVTVCTVACPRGTASLTSSVDKTIETGGMIRPEVVINQLTRVSLNADAILSEND